MAIEEGKTAPAFTLKSADGDKVSLRSFRGQDVIVYFYPKDDTPGCTKEACGFRDEWKHIRKLGAAVLGVSPDDAESHRKFAAKYKLPFPLLSDPDKKVMAKYGAWGEKMMYGKKPPASFAPPSGSVSTARCASTGSASPRPRIIPPKY